MKLAIYCIAKMKFAIYCIAKVNFAIYCIEKPKIFLIAIKILRNTNILQSQFIALHAWKRVLYGKRVIRF